MIKMVKSGVLVVLFVFSALVNVRAADPDFAVITTEDLQIMLDSPEPPCVVDARNPEEYQEVHIKGAINIPEKSLPDNAGALPEEKDKPVVFYCNGVKCGKSGRAAKKVAKLGYTNILVYSEGIPVWEERGLPIYTGPDYEKRIETTKISPQDLHELMQNQGNTVTVVDVRDVEEFGQGHIPDAINIPVAQFAFQSGVLDKNKKIVVYCNSGGRSYNAYRKLMKLAYPDINQAIFADWKTAGLPIAQL